jgi:PAS domain S-box-containing protein
MNIQRASKAQLVEELLAARQRLAKLESLLVHDSRTVTESEWSLRQAVGWAPILLFTTDDQGVVTSAEGRLLHDGNVLRPAEVDRPKVIGKSLLELVPNPDQMANRFAQALSGETTVAVEEGAGRTIESRLAPFCQADGEVVGAIGVAYDLTDRVIAEQAHRDIEQRYLGLFNGVPVGLYQTTSEGLIIDANRALATMLGLEDASALIHRRATDFYVNPLDRDDWRRRIESEGIVRDFEFQIRRADGREIWVRDSGRVVRDDEGRIRYYEGMMEDITDRRWAEETFAHLAFLVRSTDDAIIGADLDGTIRTWNPAAERMYGYSAAEARGQPIVMLAQPDRRREVFGILGRIRQGERVDHFQTTGVRKDGSQVDLSLTMSPIIDGNGKITGISIIARDITEQRHMQQRIIQSERLVAMGYVAATLAHEIRNPLQAVQSNLELLRDFPLDPDEQEAALGLCLQETERMMDITQQVLSLAPTDNHVRGPVSVLSLVQQIQTLLAKSIREAGIALTLDLPADLPSVFAAPGQIVQVLVNLVVNAIEALEGGGTIAMSAALDGQMVALTVANDGPSIPPQDLPHIFDPFFTTRSKGTGLGLFVTDNIVQQHGGSLVVENLAAGGVAFTLTLPVFHQPDPIG